MNFKALSPHTFIGETVINQIKKFYVKSIKMLFYFKFI